MMTVSPEDLARQTYSTWQFSG